MSFWVIVSWVFVAILTGINIFIFLKLKGASEQMLKMAFPNAKNMNEALAQMQGMMGGMGAMGGGAGMQRNPFTGMPTGAGRPGAPAGRGGSAADAQLRAAMEMLKKSQGGGPKR